MMQLWLLVNRQPPAHRVFATSARNARLLPRSQHELFCTVLRLEISEAYWCFKDPVSPRPESVRNFLPVSNSRRYIKENQMKFKKLLAVVFGLLVVLALSLPVMAQDTTQSTTTTTQTPAQPQTQTTQTNESTTKYKKHHKKVKKEKETTTTTTTPAPREHTETTTTTTTPPQ
jgi:cytoskeletal protein RodZ